MTRGCSHRSSFAHQTDIDRLKKWLTSANTSRLPYDKNDVQKTPKYSFIGNQIKVGQLWLNFSGTWGKVYYLMIRNILYPVVLCKCTTTWVFYNVKPQSLKSSGLVPYVKLESVPVRMSFLEAVVGVLQNKNRNSRRLHWLTISVIMCVEEHNKKNHHTDMSTRSKMWFSAERGSSKLQPGAGQKMQPVQN